MGDVLEERKSNFKEKLTIFFSDKYHILLIAILVLGFILRLKYLTINSALWWDEAEYLNIAKNWVFNIPLDINPQRPILFPAIIAFFYKLGANEAVIRFFVELIPSLGAVLMTYLLGKEFYNKKIGIIASLIMSVFWLLIFNTARVHTDALALLFNLLAIYFFWKGYIKQQSRTYIWLVGVFLALGFLTRVIAALIVLIILIFLLLTERVKFLKNKHIWVSIGLIFVVVLPYLLWSHSYYGNAFAFLQNYISTSGQRSTDPFAWYVFGFFKWFTEWLFFIIFFIGIITLYKLVLGFDLVLKNKEKRLKSDLFIVIWIIVTIIYFVFVQKAAEDRWLIPMAPALFFLIGKGFIWIYVQIKKQNKILALVIIILLLFFGVYMQIDHAHSIINAKKDSYYHIKPAGLWVKDNTNEGDNIMSNNVYMQLLYYSERQVHGIAGTEEETVQKIKELKPKYYITTIFFRSQDWSYTMPQNYPDSMMPVQAYFMDQEQTQPILIIYEITNYEF
jgi:4-amino-4-deoxy-L-arabinose transferase-like glycosyltransferase